MLSLRLSRHYSTRGAVACPLQAEAAVYAKSLEMYEFTRCTLPAEFQIHKRQLQRELCRRLSTNPLPQCRFSKTEASRTTSLQHKKTPYVYRSQQLRHPDGDLARLCQMGIRRHPKICNGCARIQKPTWFKLLLTLISPPAQISSTRTATSTGHPGLQRSSAKCGSLG